MQKKLKSSKKKVFFNASVILAGLKSPTGGSAKLLTWSKTQKIKGVISEIILDEVVRNIPKFGFEENQVRLWRKSVFSHIEKAPKTKMVTRCQKVIIDPSDAHVLASCYETKAYFLVTLDKKHLLILKKKIRMVKIVSPAELIEIFSQ